MTEVMEPEVLSKDTCRSGSIPTTTIFSSFQRTPSLSDADNCPKSGKLKDVESGIGPPCSIIRCKFRFLAKLSRLFESALHSPREVISPPSDRSRSSHSQG